VSTFPATGLTEQAALAAEQLAPVELQQHPLRHVGGGRIDRTCWTGIVEVLEGITCSLPFNFECG
jgi:hypothetical protein